MQVTLTTHNDVYMDSFHLKENNALVDFIVYLHVLYM